MTSVVFLMGEICEHLFLVVVLLFFFFFGLFVVGFNVFLLTVLAIAIVDGDALAIVIVVGGDAVVVDGDAVSTAIDVEGFLFCCFYCQRVGTVS